MQLGMVGLGRMGGNTAIRLAKAGHDCVVYDRDSKLEARAGIIGHGLFLGLAQEVIVAGVAGVRHVRRGEPILVPMEPAR